MASGDDSFYRCFKALHLVTHEAVPCVEHSLKTWHTNQQQTLHPCTVQCPAGRKPKLPGSCYNCVDWANAIETVYYQPTSGTIPQPSKPRTKQITWQNVHSPDFGKSHIEVAKAFVLRLPKIAITTTQSVQQGQQQPNVSATSAASSVATASATTATAISGSATTPQAISNVPTMGTTKKHTNISDFDSASLLMIMARFSDFHRGDQKAYELIEKISSIRNELSHMALYDNMKVKTLTEKEMFTTIEDFARWLAKMYPTFVKYQDIITYLKEIQSEPVTNKMKESLLRDIKNKFKEIKYELQVLSNTLSQVEQTALDVCMKTNQDHEILNTTAGELKQWSEKNKDIEKNLTNVVETARLTEEKVEDVIQVLDHDREIVDLSEARIVHLEMEVAQDHLTSAETAQQIDEVDEAVHHLESRVEEVFCETKDVKNRLQIVQDEIMAEPKHGEIPFDLDKCRDQLLADYRESRGKLPLFPGMPEEFAAMDELYVKLQLREESSGMKQLNSYDELFCLKDNDGNDLKRILIQGGPGGGKTTTVSKIAHDWSKSIEPQVRKEQITTVLTRYSRYHLQIIFLSAIFIVVHWCGLTFVNYFILYMVLLFCGLYAYFKQNKLPSFPALRSQPHQDKIDWVKDVRPRVLTEETETRCQDNVIKDCKQKTDWVSKCKLLFALNLRQIDSSTSLIDAIQEQCLPSVSSKGLFQYISSKASSVVFLLDGFDEAPWLQDPSLPNSNQFKSLLSKKLLRDSFVIVTTRPHKVSQFTSLFGTGIAYASLMPFSNSAVKEFIANFFNIPAKYLVINSSDDSSYTLSLDTLFQLVFVEDPPENKKQEVDKANSLLQRLLRKPKEWAISKIPILLTMICMLWQDRGDSLPDKTTEIYNEALLLIAKHNRVKYSGSEIDYDQLENEVNEILVGLGKVALNGLLEDRPEGNLVFQENDFDKDILDKALNLGLLMRERTKVKRFRVQYNISFLHKTFQEFCAAKYLADLEKTDLVSKVEMITSHNMTDLGYILQFTCGLSRTAAEIILPHCVDTSRSWLENQFGKPDFDMCIDCTDANKMDPWTLPLLLLFESHSPELYKHLKPLFGIPTKVFRYMKKNDRHFSKYFSFARMNFYIGTNLEALLALEFFLTCQISSSEGSILENITYVNIKVETISKRTIRICQHLLHCMPRIYNLHLQLPDNMLKDIKPDVLNFENSINLGNLNFLKHLCLSGGTSCLSMDSATSSSKPQTSQLALVNPSFERLQQMKRLVSQLYDLTSLFVHGIHSGGLVGTRNIVGNILDSVISKKVKKLVISNYHVPASSLRPFVNTVCELHLVGLCNDDCKALCTTLFDKGKRKLHDYKTKRSKTPLPCTYLGLIEMSEDISTGAVRLLAKSFKYLPRLSVLNLRKAKISEDGFKLIARALHNLPQLIEINLSDNDILDASQNICESLASLKRLEKVLLRNAYLYDHGISKLGKSLQSLDNVKILNISGNFIGSDMSDLCQGIRKSSCIRELSLKNCGLSDACVAMIPFASLNKLTHLFIGGSYHQCGLVVEDTGTMLIKGRERPLYFREQKYSNKGSRIILENLEHMPSLIHLEIFNARHHYTKQSTTGTLSFDDLATFATSGRLYELWKISQSRKEKEKKEPIDEDEEFLRDCYESCVQARKLNRFVLPLDREDIDAIREYIKDYFASTVTFKILGECE